MSGDMEWAVGAKAWVVSQTHRHLDEMDRGYEETVSKVGRRYVHFGNASRTRTTLSGYGEFGLRAWPSREAYRQSILAERARRNLIAEIHRQGRANLTAGDYVRAAAVLGITLDLGAT